MQELRDTYRHKGLRSKLIATLQSKGIKDNRVLGAMAQIPRHWFIDNAFEEWAYKDQAFQIDSDQTISQPFTVAVQTSLLEVIPKDRILEIGTGSGYQASVLSKLGARVYSIERQKTLFIKTSALLKEIGFGAVRTLYGDGYEGAPHLAPFDKIIITAGAIKIPQKLIDQLTIGGIMVIPFGEGDTKQMLKLTKNLDGTMKTEEHGSFRFVPFLRGVS